MHTPEIPESCYPLLQKYKVLIITGTGMVLEENTPLKENPDEGISGWKWKPMKQGGQEYKFTKIGKTYWWTTQGGGR